MGNGIFSASYYRVIPICDLRFKLFRHETPALPTLEEIPAVPEISFEEEEVPPSYQAPVATAAMAEDMASKRERWSARTVKVHDLISSQLKHKVFFLF